MTVAEQYQLFPSLSEEEYENLAEDIKARGVLVDVEVDEEGNILDGHHRAKIADSLGVNYPRKVRQFGSEDEKIEHVLNLNLSRRHLSRDQRQELVAKLRERGWSLRRIGSRLSVDDKTVRNDLSGAEISAPERIEGADGKSYAPTKPFPTIHAHSPQEQERAQELVGTVTSERPVSLQEASRGVERDSAPSNGKPHVTNNSGENEWYTPAKYIKAALVVMGSIDLDPASSKKANEVVEAKWFFDIKQNGLNQKWHGNVWLNPPYESALVKKFCDKLRSEFEAGHVKQACILVNNATETSWFQDLAGVAGAFCFPRGRIKYWHADKDSLTPLQGQAFIYLGGNVQAFYDEFLRFGFVVTT